MRDAEENLTVWKLFNYTLAHFLKADHIFAQVGDIGSWFDKDSCKEGYFSIKDTMGTLLPHPEVGKNRRRADGSG